VAFGPDGHRLVSWSLFETMKISLPKKPQRKMIAVYFRKRKLLERRRI
jgi:hypothetical protein